MGVVLAVAIVLTTYTLRAPEVPPTPVAQPKSTPEPTPAPPPNNDKVAAYWSPPLQPGECGLWHRGRKASRRVATWWCWMPEWQSTGGAVPEGRGFERRGDWLIVRLSGVGVRAPERERETLQDLGFAPQ